MGVINNIPRELDWVAARAACTVTQVFNELRTGIENDIAKHCEVMQPSDQERVTSDLKSDGSAIVIGRPKKNPNRRVFVSVSESDIKVCNDAGIPIMTAFVGLSNEGRCILRVKDGDTITELEQWQFRKLVLEPVLFG